MKLLMQADYLIVISGLVGLIVGLAIPFLVMRFRKKPLTLIEKVALGTYGPGGLSGGIRPVHRATAEAVLTVIREEIARDEVVDKVTSAIFVGNITKVQRGTAVATINAIQRELK